ncbi:hypothetical protein ACH5RR_013391 [Cinchona calisaya]|uniref:Uncharacterized protein n=1 Tax=Cinchona calisaya TaxID=153742 RepID=A0ABD3A190_9GENT
MGEFHKNEVGDSGLWSEELDRLPLKQRLKILLARRSFSDLFPDVDSEIDGASSDSPLVANDCFVKKDDGQQCGSKESFPSACSVREGNVGSWSYEQNHIGEQGDCSDQIIEANTVNIDVVPAGNFIGIDNGSLPQSPLSSHDVSVCVQRADHSSSSSFRNPSNYSSGGVLQETEITNDNLAAYFDELDHVVLKERQRMLLSSQMLELTKTSLEGNIAQLSRPATDDFDKQSAGIVKEEAYCVDKELPFAEKSACKMQKTSNSSSSKGVIGALPYHRSSRVWCHWQGNKSVTSGKMTSIQEKDETCSLEEKCSKSGANSGQNILCNKRIVHDSVVQNFINVKLEQVDNDETSLKKISFSHLPLDNMDLVKSEPGLTDDFDKDELDHMLLRDRMKLLSAEVPHSDVFGMEYFLKMVPTGLDCRPIAQESANPLKINRPRKRRKTATDSVETALEEDAPGLLQVLIQKGVSVDEIKLYGEKESDEAVEDLSTEDNFSQLEAVISKIFSQRNSSLLKLAPLRCAKGEKATYCLACLFSLVEQARYLQFRKWPIEWGWCRDLQAFIFVFERHNRIVLERPEYGYATYFFELVDSVPIDWQIKRLVIAMKLTSCSRVTLIENKALVVGEDLTEGEARVLMEYGWIPNTGLGSMLNYCERVVHDRKNEDSSEWRSKIGKLLIDGYNCGCIVSTDVPKKGVEYNFAQTPQIKMETN